MPPTAFRRNIEREFGAKGRAWLESLASLIAAYAERWSLTVGPPFDDLSYGYVAPAIRGDGVQCVLKLCIPEPASEFAAGLDCLRLWEGEGSARLLEADEAGGAVLLERLEPGTMLRELAPNDDDAATLIAADVMRRLWRPPLPEPHRFIPLRRWFRELLEHRQIHGGPGRFPPSLLDRGLATVEALLASTDKPVVLHGDLHHFNILRAEREPWLAIDPKGLVGDRGFEVAALVRNPEPHPPPPTVARRRTAILSEALELDRQRVRHWCFAEAMLNAAWSHDPPADDFDRRLAWAEMMLKL